MKKLILIIICIVSFSYNNIFPNEIIGNWTGAINVIDKVLKINVKFFLEDDSLLATIDIPEQSLYGWKLSNVVFDSEKIKFEIIISPQNIALFDGKYYNDSISGVFSQLSYTGSFYLNRALIDTAQIAQLPYIEKEVAFYNKDIKLAGTLTIPKSAQNCPAVVLVTGSGPQNRDEEIFGFKIFGIIADHLSRNGIATLRYDDRGIGGSTGKIDNSTTNDFADDALAAVHFLMSEANLTQHGIPGNAINKNKIGILGHSEGGIAASIAATKSKNVNFIVLMSSTAIKGETIVLAQMEEIMRSSGKTDEEIKKALAVQKDIFDALNRGTNLDSLKKQITDLSIEEYYKSVPTENKDSAMEYQIRQSVSYQLDYMMTPWYRFFMNYDPSDALKKIKCPVLAIFGERDVQVPAEMNKSALEKALDIAGNKNYTIKIFQKANHLYQEADTGNPSEYSTLKHQFVQGFLNYISDWIKAK